MKLVSILAGATLAVSLSAQCSTLAVSGGAPGSNLTFAVTGADALSPCILVVGDTLGSTTINLGSYGSLILGLAQPFAPISGGFTNAAGDATVNVRIPRRITPLDLHGQAVTVDLTGLPATLDFCTSNVVGFHIG